MEEDPGRGESPVRSACGGARIALISQDRRTLSEGWSLRAPGLIRSRGITLVYIGSIGD